MRNIRFWVEQAMLSPRDNTIGFRFWTEHLDKRSAIKEAKRLTCARVLEVREVFHCGYEGASADSGEGQREKQDAGGGAA